MDDEGEDNLLCFYHNKIKVLRKNNTHAEYWE